MEGLSELQKQGILGLLLALSISGNIVQYWQRDKLWEKYLNALSLWRDQSRTIAEETQHLTAGIKQTVDTILALTQARERGRHS